MPQLPLVSLELFSRVSLSLQLPCWAFTVMEVEEVKGIVPMVTNVALKRVFCWQNVQVSYDIHTNDSILVIVELDSTGSIEGPAHNCIDHSVEEQRGYHITFAGAGSALYLPEIMALKHSFPHCPLHTINHQIHKFFRTLCWEILFLNHCFSQCWLTPDI